MTELQQLIMKIHFSSEMWVIVLPIILMAIDVITGLLNAWIKNEVVSAKLRAGLSKKVGEITCIAIGELFVIALDLPGLITSGISIYILLMELISICENLDKMGVPIPKFVTRALAQTNNKIQKDSSNNKGE